mgnify:CR=1 FL=1
MMSESESRNPQMSFILRIHVLYVNVKMFVVKLFKSLTRNITKIIKELWNEYVPGPGGGVHITGQQQISNPLI